MRIQLSKITLVPIFARKDTTNKFDLLVIEDYTFMAWKTLFNL